MPAGCSVLLEQSLSGQYGWIRVANRSLFHFQVGAPAIEIAFSPECLLAESAGRALRGDPSPGYARRVAKAPISPLAVADCPHCGWRNYPSPMPINGSQLHVDWQVPTSCAGCAMALETQAATSATSA